MIWHKDGDEPASYTRAIQGHYFDPMYSHLACIPRIGFKQCVMRVFSEPRWYHRERFDRGRHERTTWTTHPLKNEACPNEKTTATELVLFHHKRPVHDAPYVRDMEQVHSWRLIVSPDQKVCVQSTSETRHQRINKSGNTHRSIFARTSVTNNVRFTKDQFSNIYQLVTC